MMEKKPQMSPVQVEELRSLVMEREQINSDLKKMTERSKLVISQIDKKVSNFLFQFGMDDIKIRADRGLVFSLDPSYIKVKRVKPKKIIWDAVALEKSIGKEASSGVIIKRHYIDDVDGFIDLMKRSGLKPADVKRYIRTERAVDQKALDQLDAIGAIDRAKLKGCYTVEEKEGYLRYTVSKDLEGCGENEKGEKAK